MFKQIKADLNHEYSIHASKQEADIAIEIYKNENIVGTARLITDNVDVSCITSIQIDDNDVNVKLNEKFTLGEAVLKFLIKFPSVVRKPEFRFILDVPDNLKESTSKHHFDRGDESNLKNEILIRRDKILPEMYMKPDGICFQERIDEITLPKLLTLLKTNAYWQTHLTIDRLRLIVSNSKCFFAFTNDGEVVGFARVLTDSRTFASLWDVIVDEQYRRKNIGITLMFNIFTNDSLKEIKNWVLFTDSAKGLYQKFGFVSADDIPNRKLVHKLRLQETHPAYMAPLIESISNGHKIHLTANQTCNFLFGEQGKRANLLRFWNEYAKPSSNETTHDELNDHRKTI